MAVGYNDASEKDASKKDAGIENHRLSYIKTQLVLLQIHGSNRTGSVNLCVNLFICKKKKKAKKTQQNPWRINQEQIKGLIVRKDGMLPCYEQQNASTK